MNEIVYLCAKIGYQFEYITHLSEVLPNNSLLPNRFVICETQGEFSKPWYFRFDWRVFRKIYPNFFLWWMKNVKYKQIYKNRGISYTV